jgi:magnesium transporter
MSMLVDREQSKDPARPFQFLFLSEILGRPVIAADGARIGRLSDVIVVGGEPYPRVDAILVRARDGETLLVPAAGIEAIERTRVRLTAHAQPLPDAGTATPERIRLVAEILDRQIVDVEGAKVVRVNDLHFLEANGALRLAHVDVGFRGLVRRMGWERTIDGVVRGLRPAARYLGADQLLPWKLVQPLDLSPGKIRLDVAQRLLATMHPADLAEVLEDLDRPQRTQLFSRMDLETAADALEEASPEVANQLLEEMPAEKAADIVEEMDADEAADVLGDLQPETREEVLEAMEAPEAQELERLLEHPTRSAGGLMNPNVMKLEPGITVAGALSAIRREAHEGTRIEEVYVVNGGTLGGMCALRDLVLAEPHKTLAEIAHEVPATVGVDATLADVAEIASKYTLTAVPVLDETGLLIGAVTVDDILTNVLHVD